MHIVWLTGNIFLNWWFECWYNFEIEQQHISHSLDVTVCGWKNKQTKSSTPPVLFNPVSYWSFPSEVLVPVRLPFWGLLLEVIWSRILSAAFQMTVGLKDNIKYVGKYCHAALYSGRIIEIQGNVIHVSVCCVICTVWGIVDYQIKSTHKYVLLWVWWVGPTCLCWVLPS